jgi:thymidylate synthase ThyX
MIKVTGKGNISTTIIAHSKSAVDGKEIITYELEYHRYIHSELMTHRTFSRNAASSRAIPVSKMINLVRTSPATPIHWGKNQAGMQASEECDNKLDWYKYEDLTPTDAWKVGMYSAIEVSQAFNEAGYHKQITNRLLEPFQMIKVVVTATEWDNFFWLRFHKAAQPEIQELARCMLVAKKRSVAEVLQVGEWHTPYVAHFRASDGDAFLEYHSNNLSVTLEEALKISASCCAQVSYRKTDDSLEKADKVWQMLTTDERIHSSPTEHQATPMKMVEWDYNYSALDMTDTPKGYTHVDKSNKFWSNNFCGWIQHRALIANNNCTSFDYDQEIDETGLVITDNKET